MPFDGNGARGRQRLFAAGPKSRRSGHRLLLKITSNYPQDWGLGTMKVAGPVPIIGRPI